jgi:hypothetical protein
MDPTEIRSNGKKARKGGTNHSSFISESGKRDNEEVLTNLNQIIANNRSNKDTEISIISHNTLYLP